MGNLAPYLWFIMCASRSADSPSESTPTPSPTPCREPSQGPAFTTYATPQPLSSSLLGSTFTESAPFSVTRILGRQDGMPTLPYPTLDELLNR